MITLNYGMNTTFEKVIQTFVFGEKYIDFQKFWTVKFWKCKFWTLNFGQKFYISDKNIIKNVTPRYDSLRPPFWDILHYQAS